MASVTGYWGGQNIELNNAATEQTQQQVKQLLASIDAGIRAGGAGGGAASSALSGAFGRLAVGAAESRTALGKLGSAAGALATGSLFVLGKALGTVNNALYATARGIGQFDGGLADLGQGIRGITDELGGLGALVQSSIGQYQRQFQAFGQMSQMGAGAAVKLDNLQNTAADLGMSLPQYTQMIQQFAGSFTYGGANISKSIALFNKSMLEGITGNKENRDMLRQYGVAYGDQVAYVMKVGAAYNRMNDIIGMSGPKLGKFLDESATRLGTLAQITGKSTEAMLAEQAAARKDNAVTFNEQVLKSLYGDEFKSMYDAYYALTGDTKATLQEMTTKILGAPTSLEQVLNQAGMPDMASKLYGAKGQEQQSLINEVRERLKVALGDKQFAVVMAQMSKAGNEIAGKILGNINAQGTADPSKLKAANDGQLQLYGDMEDQLAGLNSQISRVNQGMIRFGTGLTKLAVVGELYVKAMQGHLQDYVKEFAGEGKVGDLITQMSSQIGDKIEELIKEGGGRTSLPSPALAGNGVPPIGSNNSSVSSTGGTSGTNRLVSANTVASGLSTEQSALLNMIAGPESGGDYNAINYVARGVTGQRPLQKTGAAGHHPFEGQSGYTAAGRYQYLWNTWNAAAQSVGLNPADFSPENQDRVTSAYIKKEYERLTRRSFDTDIKDPARMADIIKYGMHDWAKSKGGPGFNPEDFTRSMANTARLGGATVSTAVTGSASVAPPALPTTPTIGTGPVIGSSAGTATVQETEEQKQEREKKEAEARTNHPAVVAARNTSDNMQLMVNKLGQLVGYADDQLQELQAIRKHTAEQPNYEHSAYGINRP
jgi:hypothetical protein